MTFDINQLTLGEVSRIESLSGQSIGAFGDDDLPKGKMLAALALVAKRRSGFPQFTWDQAQDLTMDEATELLGMTYPDEADDEQAPELEADQDPKALEPQPEL